MNLGKLCYYKLATSITVVDLARGNFVLLLE